MNTAESSSAEDPAAASRSPATAQSPDRPATPPAGAPTPRPRRQPVDEAIFDPAAAMWADHYRPDLAELRPQRRWLVPLLLLLATFASTFWVGVAHWEPLRPEFAINWQTMLAVIRANWRSGLEYMAAIMGILIAHEMGHFVFTVRYRIPASYPIFIPVPFNAIGTMGAIIGMDGMRANRRQIFDIGVAGPLAGLVVALPVLWFGVQRLDLSTPTSASDIHFYLPLVGQWMLATAHPDAAWSHGQWVGLSQLNPLVMAGWVGMLITGLNMLPISQLDGGHVIYALFRRRAHTLARIFISLAILYVVVNLDEAVLWTPMLLLVIFLGIHHPPTANDRMPLGPVRWLVGLASLAIPVLCFPLLGLR